MPSPKCASWKCSARCWNAAAPKVLRCPLVTIYDSPHSAQVLAFAVQLAEGGFDDFVLITGEGLTRILSCIDKYEPRVAAAFRRGSRQTSHHHPRPETCTRAARAGAKPGIEATEPTTDGVIQAMSSLELAGGASPCSCTATIPTSR